MGMFDTLYIEKKLPLPAVVKDLKIDWKKEDFQTKDFERLMNTYKVTKSGQLLTLQQEREWVEDGSRFGGHFETKSEKWVKSSYTGIVIFYTTVCSDEEQKSHHLMEFATEQEINEADGFDYSLDFQAKFIDGKLKELKLVSVDAYPIKQYLISHNEWLKKVNADHAKISYKIKSFLRKNIPCRGYNRFINLLNKFIGFQQKLIIKLY
jgi:hypothetical protein